MSFMLTCPNCGKRHVGEYTFRGYYKPRPQQSDDFSSWVDYVYFNENKIGKQWEWWYHSSGCQRWFIVERDSANSTDHRSVWFEERDRLLNNKKHQTESQL